MTRLSTMLFVAGLLHFAILSASALVPVVLDWRRALAPLHPFLRQLVWVYGAFVVLTIVGFGALSLLHHATLSAGSPLARSLCAFIALFWAARLYLQLFVFDIRPIVKSRLLRFCDHLLTLVFAYFTLTYTLAALHPRLLG